MQTDLPLFQRRQLEVIARVTPHAMAGHILNTTVLAFALAGAVPTAELILWCVYSYAIALVLLYRHVRGRGRVPRHFGHAASRATVYAFLLALPWSTMTVLHLGALGRDQELILLALVVGMAASGTVLLSAVPSAAFGYMSGILVPGAVKCLIFLDQRVYLLLGVLALSYWWFLAALIMKIAREITEREQAEGKLNETEGELRRLLGALGERNTQFALAEKSALVGSFAYDVGTDMLQVSDGYAAIHGFPNETKEIPRSRWLAGVHPEDRARVDELRSRAFSAGSPEYNFDFRIVRSGGEVRWIEGRAFVAYRDGGSPQRVAGVNIDVTERKRAEAAIEESRARYRALYDDNPSMYFTVDASGTVLSVNEFGARQLGYRPAELVGRSVLEVVHEGDHEGARRWLASCAQNAGTIATTEMRKVRRDGSTMWVRKVARAVQGFGGQALIVVCEDITERKKAELALAEREAQLALAGKAARVGSFVVDYATLLIQASPGFAALHGLAEEAQELTCEEWQAHLHPDDLARFEAQRSRVFAERRRELNMEYRIVGADGEARWIESRGLVSYDGGGRPGRLVGVHIDITERKQAEERLQESERKVRELLGALPAAIYVTDAVGHIIYCNQSAVDLWGTEPVLGKDKWSDLVKFYHADGSPMVLEDCPTEVALKHGRIARGQEAIVERRGGTRIPVIPYPTPLRDESGTIVGVVNMTVDISERRKVELALAERNIQLSLAGKAVLVGSYSYDTNTEMMQISEGYVAIHGFPEGTTEIARSECLAGVHPDDIGRAEQARSEAFRACRGEYSVEYRIVRPDNEMRWVETRCFISYGSEGRPQRVVGVSIDITERKRVEEQQGKLVAELDHRVKNVLATVQAIAAQTLQASSTMEHFVAALDGRIRSMGLTHELLSHRRWRGIPLAELVGRELAPYATGSNTEFSGPEVMLSAEAGQAMATVLHELVTNAAKHGALSASTGRVSIDWRLPLNGSASGRLALSWRETGGPLVVSPSKSGYGMDVVRSVIPYELGGTVDHVLAPEGARCRMEIPLAHLRAGSSLTNGSVPTGSTRG